MNIKEAIEKAMKENGFARRKNLIFGKGSTLVKPTNMYTCCTIVIEGEKDQRVGRWSPTAEDLLADDWEVKNES